MPEPIKGKPPLRRIPSDDCEVEVDGTVYLPHIGEWVEVVPIRSVGEYQAIAALSQFGQRLAEIKGDPDEDQKRELLTNQHFEELCQALAGRVRAWNWTGLNGQPVVPWTDTEPGGQRFALLDGSPDPFRRLASREIYWLLTAREGETPAQEKKDSAPSPTSSSASKRRASRG